MRKGIFIFLFAWVVLTPAKGQHQAMYSQYMFNMMALNPAYAGSRDVLSTIGLFRMQWTGFEGAPRTLSFAAHAPTRNPKNNFGISLLNDQLGVSHHNSVMGTYAYRIPLGKARLSFGLHGGISFLQDRFSEVVTTNPNDPSFNADSPVFMVPRFGAGAYLDGNRFFLGFAAPQIIEFHATQYDAYVQNSFSYKPVTLSGGYLFRLNPDVQLRPTVLVKYIQNSPLGLDLNAHLILKNMFWIGASWRKGDALVGMIEVQLNPQFKLGYAFDYTLTPLGKYNNGSHEFMLRYEFGYKIKAMSPRYF